MKYAPYSFSKLNTHSACARKFKYQYITKPERSPSDKTPLLKGLALHSILENYPAPSSHKYADKYQDIADKFISSDIGQKMLMAESVRELSIGMDSNLNPCAFNDKSAIFRGYIDFVGVFDGILTLVDWKSGRYKEEKYQNYNQLLFYAIYFFHKYPKINRINISYVYIEHELNNNLLLDRKFLNIYERTLKSLISVVEKDNTFNKNESRLCEWCDYRQFCLND